MPLWARQGLVIAAGGAVAVVMIWLGLWQSQVFTDQGNASAQARAQQQAVPLLDHIAADGTVGDIYGKPVTVNGRYLRDQQELVLGPDGVVRVLTALQLADGRVLPVVRGTLVPGTQPPVPPAGDLEQQGIFLPSEAASDHPLTRGYTLGSVRLAQLAQVLAATTAARLHHSDRGGGHRACNRRRSRCPPVTARGATAGTPCSGGCSPCSDSV